MCFVWSNPAILVTDFRKGASLKNAVSSLKTFKTVNSINAV
jgi:hypothetical protein